MKASLSKLLKAAPIVILTATCSTGQAALDMFLKIEGVPGESVDAKHQAELDVLAFSIGGSNSFDPVLGTGGKANLQHLSVTTWMSKASPTLSLACATGKIYPTARLVVRRAGTNPIEFYTLTLSNVAISSFSTGASGGEDRMTENYTLSYTAIEWSYTPVSQTGLPLTPVKTSYDLRTAK